MVTLSDIQQKRAEILKLADKYGAVNVRVFGSVVRGTAVEGSDLDLLVRMLPGRSLIDRIALMQDLEDMLHIKVDVVNEKVLHKATSESVLKEAVPL
jgi:predicted nucleotidyltransferase